MRVHRFDGICLPLGLRLLLHGMVSMLSCHGLLQLEPKRGVLWIWIAIRNFVSRDVRVAHGNKHVFGLGHHGYSSSSLFQAQHDVEDALWLVGAVGHGRSVSQPLFVAAPPLCHGPNRFQRVSVFSIWRLATIIAHKAATSPTFDPTWYGPISIVLAAVEIDSAMICASVPVFWPVFRSAGFQIFITKEIKVTSEQRLSSSDGLELRGDGPGIFNSSAMGSMHSRAGSEETLTNVEIRLAAAKTQGHYTDKYVMELVDPLRASGRKQGGIEVSVSAERMIRDGKERDFGI